MTIENCADCGGMHYGSNVCPYRPEEILKHEKIREQRAKERQAHDDRAKERPRLSEKELQAFDEARYGLNAAHTHRIIADLRDAWEVINGITDLGLGDGDPTKVVDTVRDMIIHFQARIAELEALLEESIAIRLSDSVAFDLRNKLDAAEKQRDIDIAAKSEAHAEVERLRKEVTKVHEWCKMVDETGGACMASDVSSMLSKALAEP